MILLAPALAFLRRRELVPLVRLLRPELAAIPHPLRAARVREHFWGLFARPERLDPAAADIAADEFCRTYRSRSARIAFFAAARNVYLDRPHGERGLWTRLADLRPPAMFIWGDSDRLVPASFSRHVADVLAGRAQGVGDRGKLWSQQSHQWHELAPSQEGERRRQENHRLDPLRLAA